MEREENKKSTVLCDDCNNLNGKGRHYPPHENLQLKNITPYSSPMGSADERNYECKKCNSNWLRETGSYGHGWILLN